MTSPNEEVHVNSKSHQPYPFHANDGPLTRSLGHWVECECGSITAGYRTAAGALLSWNAHYKKATGEQ
jgi:hypothetical protein